MAPKIYGLEGNHRSNSVRIVAEYEGIAVDFVAQDRDSKSKEFTEAFPTELLPALVDENGYKVFETQAVAYYLASKSNKANLFGKSTEEKTEVLQWVSWINANLISAFGSWLRPIIFGPFNKKTSDESKALSAKLLAVVDKYLADKTWLVSQRITYADILLGCVIQRGADHVVDVPFLAQYPNVRRHFNTILRQPEAVKIYGKEPTVIEKAKEYVPVEKKKADKPAAAAPAAAAPKKEKKPAQPKDDEEDDTVVDEPKAKHPCEALGRPTFVLDDWKRKYSNEDTPVALKWFWENYKPEEYSLWKAEYKYNDELTLVFMSSNLIGGFHTRLEGSRKYLFGNACVYGENNNSRVQGIYLVRGDDFKPVFEVGPDYESYKFTKLDPSKEEDRKAVDANWSWEDEVDGLKAADGKVFK